MILEQITQRTWQRVQELKRQTPLSSVQAMAESLPAETGFRFEQALKSEDIAFICEIKKASPSKGVIAPDFPYLQIAADYETAGAAALSVLTEPHYFLGSDRYLQEIASRAGIPVLRKDFTIDAYQIHEAKCLGASAVLLIVALLDQEKLRDFLTLAHHLGLSALVEAHTEQEVHTAVETGARIIGVNNRDLSTFEVDLTTAERLRPLVPPGILFVSESGIRSARDVARLRAIGTDGVLIGESLMRSSDKKKQLAILRGEMHDEDQDLRLVP